MEHNCLVEMHRLLAEYKRNIEKRRHPQKTTLPSPCKYCYSEMLLSTETVEGSALPLESVDNVERSD